MEKKLISKQNRLCFVDYAKAFGIFLVVFAHSPYNILYETMVGGGVKKLIYAFSMPLFFILYGITWKCHYDFKRNNIRDGLKYIWGFLKRKFFRLLFPAFLWGMIYAPFSLKNIFFVLYGSQKSFVASGSLSSLWFLPCMFLACFMFELLMIFQINRKPWMQIIFAIFFSIIGFFISHIYRPQYGWLWSIDVAFMATSFILWGNVLKGVFDKISTKFSISICRFVYACIFILASILLIFTYRFNLPYLKISNVDLASGSYGNYFLFILDALAGSIAILSISKLIEILFHFRFLQSIGKTSMAIFILHKPILLLLTSFLQNQAVFGFLLPNTLIVFISVFIAFFFSYILGLFIRYYFPWMLGERNEKNSMG